MNSEIMPVLWCDNQSTVYMSANPVLHSRTKHIEIDLHFVREYVQKGKLQISHLPATYQRADMLTKALSARSFNRFRSDMKVEDSEDSTISVTSDPINNTRTGKDVNFSQKHSQISIQQNKDRQIPTPETSREQEQEHRGLREETS